MTAPVRSPIEVSIIISTYNRAELLRATLDQLTEVRRRTAIPHEVIVVDNASTDDTPGVIRSAAAVLPIIYVRETRIGTAAARNAGLAHASGSFLFFTDEDCMVSTDWLEVGVELLRDNPRQVIGGWIGLHDERDLPLTVKFETAPARLDHSGGLFGFMHGCNLICGRCVVDEIGPFDPLFGAGTSVNAAEDTDLVYRALLASVPVRYEPSLRVTHNHGRRTADDSRRLGRAYEISIGALVMKHALRRQMDIVRAVYWRMRPEQGRHTWAQKWYLLRGATNYVRAAVQVRRGRLHQRS